MSVNDKKIIDIELKDKEIIEEKKQTDFKKSKRKVLPVLPLRGLPVFPYMILHFDVKRTFSVKALEEAVVENQIIFLVAQKDPLVEKVEKEDLFTVGTVARIKQVLKLPQNDVRVLIEGISRARILNFVSQDPYFECEIEEFESLQDESEEKKIENEAMIRKIKNMLAVYYDANPKFSVESVKSMINITEPAEFSDLVSANVNFDIDDKQALLEEFDVNKRLEKLIVLLDKEIKILSVERDINRKVKGNIDKNQKEFYLREQLKVIQSELGDKDGMEQEASELEDKLISNNVPDFVLEKAKKELSRMVKMQSGNPEASVIRNYVEWLCDIPWSIRTEENDDIENAKKVLDEDHFGLLKVKERILEYLAVRKLSGNLKSPIICLVGPPGVGKTSIASSVARALNRNYARISLGGVKDESEIRGHRKTYIGSMPGRIISALKQAKSNNPLILLDEVDKMSRDFKGDPSSALLEVLDAEQNFSFRDHYIELPFDLSNVLFITTANSLETIDRPLLDRMEVINISGYTDEEKLNIAKNYLIPKQIKLNGLKKSNVKFSDSAIISIINNYTRESGVRSLERKIAAVLRKVAKIIVSGEKKSVSVSEKNIESFLERKIYLNNEKNDESEVGIATGLAWTQYGGDTLSIEVNVSKGTGKIELTGSLGDVMKESAMAAISYTRSCAKEYNINENFYKENDIHIHVPEGATPKDGPSAGITMATALISALSGKRVKKDVAMTGEITLRGRVLPIGGLKEKVLAAFRIGIKTIIIPCENERDLIDIPENIREKINFVIAKNMQTVLTFALEE
ncbi:MAG: endopeptidase La [Ruminococcaceae bacterium]|nr:endopeptidase La [Oscillospiraceae bacterium]